MPKILIPVDDSATSLKTINEVIAHKDRMPQKVTLLHVVNDQLAYRMIPDFQIEMVRENAGKAGQVKLEQIATLLQEAGFETDLRLEFGSPRRVIPQVANDEKFELLIIGRRETTGEIRDVLFGSVANFVLHNVKCPVLLF
ncbi:Nucleotide-binding universal stress protein, UspA family [Malonomonas rubra DSM 5091]|uniref:Nucleotide-binding universal stress protein, UspA family n=1 Tax=Malonomonas rubra DSM 5091 TaxID=1122189 RepID=A0A1M6IPH0_MALRU|nr:universal stress protein [Malonomonas rubra]SHJ36249.1 Nucleotide-binding universal stress protein, UspA family [Malonomonas rubra DSM 5091]